MAERADAFTRHDKELREIVASFHASVERGANAVADAEAKAAKLVKDAETRAIALRAKGVKDAAGHDDEAADAVRRMLELGESREAVMALTDWSAERVRESQRPGGGKG
jgi:hypothetical protein